MQLKKTKLAGVISLLFCSSAMAVTTTGIVKSQTDESRFGPYASAMSADTGTIATYTQTYAQPFWFDIGAPWTYNEYCVYNSSICEMLWDGSKSDLSDGLQVWRTNILNTYNSTYNGDYLSESISSIGETPEAPTGNITKSRKITAINNGGTIVVGYGTGDDPVNRITRRGFYNDTELLAADFTGDASDKGGFSSAHDFVTVSVSDTPDKAITYTSTLVVGQSSVSWANADDSLRFSYCFDFPIDDDRYDYDDLYYCPGFDLQASYWNSDGSGLGYFSDDLATKWIGTTGGYATYIANAYAINTSGFAVGFSTQQIHSSVSGGRARATIFKPTVIDENTLNYAMSEITKPKTEAPGDNKDDVIRDTVAIDITDTVFDGSKFGLADGTTTNQAFIVVGNRTFAQSQNRNYATEFFTYNVANQETRYPLMNTPIKGANSRVNKINNDGLAVGWRDARGETSTVVNGSPRFQSAFLYDFETNKSAYLDDMYCVSQTDKNLPVTIRLTNAISISDDLSGEYTILANGYDYGSLENYRNKTGSSPVVVTMTYKDSDFYDATQDTTCPTKESEDYKREGASMNWFILLPMMMLLFRRFKR